jgi:hypothetical protein
MKPSLQKARNLTQSRQDRKGLLHYLGFLGDFATWREAFFQWTHWYNYPDR